MKANWAYQCPHCDHPAFWLAHRAMLKIYAPRRCSHCHTPIRLFNPNCLFFFIAKHDTPIPFALAKLSRASEIFTPNNGSFAAFD